MPQPRLAARAVVVHDDRLLLVNAWADQTNDLWCAPGGGVERGASLPDTLKRELWEECGLRVQVGAPCLINEFADPASGFHQVEVFFRATVTDATLDPNWQDPEAVVNRRRWVTRDQIAALRVKPDRLAQVAWGSGSCAYDPLERLIR